jgi:lipid-binding SYLF domain-containing protein
MARLLMSRIFFYSREVDEQVDVEIPLEPVDSAEPDGIKKKSRRFSSKKKRKSVQEENGDNTGTESAEIPMSGGLKLALGYGHVVLETLRQRIPPATFFNAKGILIVSASRAGFFVTASSSTALLLWRNEDKQWGFPWPIQYQDIAVGPMAGASNAYIVYLITEEEFLDRLLAGEKLQLKRGIHRMFARPKGSVVCSQERNGMRYVRRAGMMAGAGFRFVSIRLGSVSAFYGKVCAGQLLVCCRQKDLGQG